jgi:O-antigen ligase
MALTLGMGYLGYEATINERGSFSSGRLEGIGAAGVTSSNQLSSLLITGLPISIGLVFTSMSKWLKLVVLICGGLTFNVVLFCNSRGAFLGLIAGGVAFLLMASGPARKKAIGLVAGTAIVTFVLLGDPRIVERFLTIFTSEGQRDSSAQGRIVFWTAAREMLADYPFGSGGNSFSEGRGWRYMPGAQASGTDQDKAGETRAIHNGYLTEAVDWGVQGLALALLFLGAIGWTLRRGRKLVLAARDPNAVMVFGCIAAGLVGWMVSSFFGDYINDEWGFWAGAIAYSYLRVWVFARAAEEVPRESAPAPVPAFSPAWPRLTP